MRLRFVTSLWLLLLPCALSAVVGQSATQKEAVERERREWEQLVERFGSPQSYNLLTSGMWTLTHAAESKHEVDEIFKLLTLLHDSSLKQDSSLVNKNGGAKGFKDKLATFLESKDDVVAGFAATMLGICGDLQYAPGVAKLLDKDEPPEPDDAGEFQPPVSSRGRAAVALSLMGAREYIPKFVSMLKSSNDYDRAGAATALGQLRAKEHAMDVARLLGNQGFRDDDSPIYALMEMGVGAEYSAKFAKVLQSDFRVETVKTAAYALAKLGAREYAKDIAGLLKKEYRKGDAAKALAIMGAAEYVDEIALLLKDKNSLNRKDALLALGVLRARKYLPQVATHLNDPEGFVQNYAAYALTLMEADAYASKIIPLVENAYREGVYLNSGDFHPLVAEDLEKIRKRFSDSYLKMKAHRPQ